MQEVELQSNNDWDHTKERKYIETAKSPRTPKAERKN